MPKAKIESTTAIIIEYLNFSKIQVNTTAFSSVFMILRVEENV
jgi:hypothetical protein